MHRSDVTSRVASTAQAVPDRPLLRLRFDHQPALRVDFDRVVDDRLVVVVRKNLRLRPPVLAEHPPACRVQQANNSRKQVAFPCVFGLCQSSYKVCTIAS